ncbi:hypothetical protein CHS0354_007122 [Potamilus streckersoni]|uniref:Uncharacterized protein n=1 Tax=Potamilus streckersoni TaxID=2493646 RepID=A0AAE0T2S8_9BIVA|nr:hypothetical protein CHS0354_007122 [Potamilus streckersoni]
MSEPVKDNTEKVIYTSPEEKDIIMENNTSKEEKWQDGQIITAQKSQKFQLIERDIAPYFILEEPHIDGKKSPETVECQNSQENKTIEETLSTSLDQPHEEKLDMDMSTPHMTLKRKRAASTPKVPSESEIPEMIGEPRQELPTR